MRHGLWRLAQAVGVQELLRDARGRLLFDVHGGVHLLYRLDREQRADLVQRFAERRSLRGEDAAPDDRRDVLEAEHVLWIDEQRELAAEQLAIGGEHVLYVDLPTFEGFVRQFDRDRHKRRAYAVFLLDAGQSLKAGGEFRRRPELDAAAEALEVGDALQAVLARVAGQRREHIGVEEGRGLQQREPVLFDERLCLAVGSGRARGVARLAS